MIFWPRETATLLKSNLRYFPREKSTFEKFDAGLKLRILFDTHKTIKNRRKNFRVIYTLRTIPTTKDVPLRDLTLKTVMLMSLVLAQRGQTIHMLNLEDMTNTESQITFVMSKPIKQTKAGVKSVPIKFTSFSADPTLCVVTTLKEYF